MTTKVRLIDIANATGVSVSAVSKALKDSPELPQATKERILAAANRLGYHPNFTARSLRLGRSNLLGVLIPDITNPYYASILKGIESTARVLGLTTIITITNEDPTIESDALSAFLSVPVDGILSVPIHLNNYVGIKIPLVLLSRFPFLSDFSYNSDTIPEVDFNYVLSDDYKGQYLATKHLLECGIQDIYLILSQACCEKVSGMKSAIRLSGHQKALRDFGIPFDPQKIFYEATDNQSSFDIVDMLCQKANPPFGLSLVNDASCAGAISALNKHNLKIPEDVQIIGYDDIELSQFLYPSLTTIHSAKQSIGEHGVSLISNMISRDNPPKSKVHTVFDPYLVVRQSTHNFQD